MAKRERVQQAFLPILAPLQPDPAPLMVLPPQSATTEKPMLDLSDAEMSVLLRALDPARVRYAPYSSAKRIARSVCGAEASTLSVRMRNAVIRIAWRYRRQLPIPVRLALARFNPKIFK